MILILDDNWYIDADTTSVALTEKRLITGDASRGIAPKAENVGKFREIQHGFFGTVAQAATAYLNKGVASMPGMMNATQIIASWAEMTAKIEAVCKTLPRTAAAAQPRAVVNSPDGVLPLPLRSSEPTHNLPQA